MLHHHGATLVALWSLFLNSYLRKEDLRRCKNCSKLNFQKIISFYSNLLHIFSFDLVIKSDIIAYYWYGLKEWLVYMKSQKSRVNPNIEIEMVSR